MSVELRDKDQLGLQDLIKTAKDVFLWLGPDQITSWCWFTAEFGFIIIRSGSLMSAQGLDPQFLPSTVEN